MSGADPFLALSLLAKIRPPVAIGFGRTRLRRANQYVGNRQLNYE